MDRIRVMIVDDHMLFRDGLRTLLSTAADAELVGEAATGEEAIARVAELRPDVILMDLQMPGMGGIEATRHILNITPEVGIVMVTMFEDDSSVFAAMRAGARGYLLKDATHEQFLMAVRAVKSGDALFSSTIARRMVDFFAGMMRTPQAAAQPFPELTDREREVLTLMAHGDSNSQIASKLYLSMKTVRNHVSNILGKLQAADRVEAVIRAKDAGLA